MRVMRLVLALTGAALLPAALMAQEEKPVNVGDLAKAAQNPVASLISIPSSSTSTAVAASARARSST